MASPRARAGRNSRPRRPLAEALEGRTLLSVVPFGPEARVNTYIYKSQEWPAIAMTGDGSYVVTWDSDGQDGDGTGVYAQRFGPTGTPRGGEFRVNTYTANRQDGEAVAMDAAGNFVVAWESYGQDGSRYGIYARQYTAAGVPRGGEFRVNVTTDHNQWSPAVAMDAAGNSVIAWSGYNQDGYGDGVYARRYDAAGAAQGGEFRVNTTTSGVERFPAVAADPDGDFVVAWTAYGRSPGDGPDGQGSAICAQRYDAAGVPRGGETRASPAAATSRFNPSVAMSAAGGFVVAYQTYGEVGSGAGVYFRQFDATGRAVSDTPGHVNTTADGSQSSPWWRPTRRATSWWLGRATIRAESTPGGTARAASPKGGNYG